MNNKNIRTALINPPVSDVTQMYPALPSLAAFLKRNNKYVQLYDVNIEFYMHILTTEYIQHAYKELTSNYNNKLTKNIEIVNVVYKSTLQNIEKALELIKDENIYHDIKQYRWCTNTIENALFIVSSVFYPTKIGLFSYSMKYKNESSADVENALNDERENPFITYYRDIICNGYLSKLKSFDLVGLSITYQNQLIPALTLVKELKLKFPHLKFVVGGQLVTQSILPFTATLLLDRHFDYVIYHEGETALYKLVEHLEGKILETDIPNLIKVSTFGTIRDNDSQCASSKDDIYIENMDELPVPDFNGFPYHKYLSPVVLLLVPTRGCYWNKCAFCDISSSMKKKYRERSVEKVANDITVLSELYSTKYFNFSVDAMSPKYLKKLSQILIKKEIKIKWGAELRIEKAFADPLFAKQLYNSGMHYVFFGFETGSQYVNDYVKKGTSVSKSEEVVKVFSQAGMKIYLAWIAGLPGEKEEDFWESADFIYRNKKYIYSAGISEFYLSINTPMGRNPEKYGLTIKQNSLDLSVSRDYSIDIGFSQEKVLYFANIARKFLEDTFILFTNGGLNPHSFVSALKINTTLQPQNNNIYNLDKYKLVNKIVWHNSKTDNDKWYLFNEVTQKLYLFNEYKHNIILNGFCAANAKEQLFGEFLIKEDLLKLHNN